MWVVWWLSNQSPCLDSIERLWVDSYVTTYMTMCFQMDDRSIRECVSQTWCISFWILMGWVGMTKLDVAWALIRISSSFILFPLKGRFLPVEERKRCTFFPPEKLQGLRILRLYKTSFGEKSLICWKPFHFRVILEKWFMIFKTKVIHDYWSSKQICSIVFFQTFISKKNHFVIDMSSKIM